MANLGLGVLRKTRRASAGSRRAVAARAGVGLRELDLWEDGRARMSAKEVEEIARLVRRALRDVGFDISLSEIFHLLRAGQRATVPLSPAATCPAGVEDPLSSIVRSIRRVERALFSADRSSREASSLAAIRGEVQRLQAGFPVRVEVIQRALAATLAKDSRVSVGETVTQEVS